MHVYHPAYIYICILHIIKIFQTKLYRVIHFNTSRSISPQNNNILSEIN